MKHTINYASRGAFRGAFRGGSATLRERLTLQLSRANARHREVELLALAGVASPMRARKERLHVARLTELVQLSVR